MFPVGTAEYRVQKNLMKLVLAQKYEMYRSV